MDEPAEMPERMDILHKRLQLLATLQLDTNARLDRVLPWREEKTDFQDVVDKWEEIWENPEEFASGEIELGESDEEFIFYLGVNFGIEYERAYPLGNQEEWPVDIEER